MNSNSALRIRLLLGFLCCLALVLVAKLYFVQIVHGDDYVKQADKQYVRSVNPIFDRGSIFFTAKTGNKVGAATVKEGYTLVMNPKLIKDPETTYEAISQYAKMDKDDFMQKASKVDDQYEELQKRVDRDVGISIGELKIPGIDVTPDSWRVYPGGTLASHTIGLIGYDNKNQLAGRYGLERYYEKTLNRTDEMQNVNFFAQLFADVKGDDSISQSKKGDIVASIDPTVENELEKVLDKTQKEWQSDSIGGIIMDPKSGEIYAMALHPSFDPNNLKDVSDPHIFSNQLVEGTYEMGSIMKPITMAIGIDSKAITPTSTYDDKGFLILNEKKISNYDGVARGVIPMQEILNQSLNVGAATIALRVGSENFSRYMLSFGLGDLTGIDQPNEQKGRVSNLKTGREIEQATASYGQGIAVSPIEMTRSLSVLANGGLLIKPHLIKEIEYSDGTAKKIVPDAGVRIIQKETAEDVTRMLVEVVDKALRKGQVKMEHYSIAAKTGTAQIADPVNGGYYTDRYLHSFFGYFPAYNPRYIVFLYHIYPKGAQYASETLTDPFIEIAKFLINYYEIPPDR